MMDWNENLETTMAEASGGGQAPRAQERASLLADARAALTWVYANDDGADLRVPLAGACAARRQLSDISGRTSLQRYSGLSRLGRADARRRSVP